MIVGVATVRGWFTPAPRGTRDPRRELASAAGDDAIRRHLRDLYVRPGTWAADLIGGAA